MLKVFIFLNSNLQEKGGNGILSFLYRKSAGGKPQETQSVRQWSYMS